MSHYGLLIGQLAAQSGVSRKAIRLYEALGILEPPARTNSGYRAYGPGTLSILRFVRRARRLGLSLNEISAIVAIRRGGQAPCVHVLGLLRGKAAELERALREVRAVLDSRRSPGRRVATICPRIEGEGGERNGRGANLAVSRMRRVPAGRAAGGRDAAR